MLLRRAPTLVGVEMLGGVLIRVVSGVLGGLMSWFEGDGNKAAGVSGVGGEAEAVGPWTFGLLGDGDTGRV
jgi:hypothetical protein